MVAMTRHRAIIVLLACLTGCAALFLLHKFPVAPMPRKLPGTMAKRLVSWKAIQATSRAGYVGKVCEFESTDLLPDQHSGVLYL